MPRANTALKAKGWPSDADEYRIAGQASHDVYWAQLTDLQKRYIIYWFQNREKPTAVVARNFGKDEVWYYYQRDRSKTREAFRYFTDPANFPTFLPLFQNNLVAEIIVQTLLATTEDIMSDDPKRRTEAVKYGWGLINARIKQAQNVVTVRGDEPAMPVMQVRPPSDEEVNRYRAKGTPSTIEAEVLDRDD